MFYGTTLLLLEGVSIKFRYHARVAVAQQNFAKFRST